MFILIKVGLKLEQIQTTSFEENESSKKKPYLVELVYGHN